ncbi:MAG: NAD(P)-dependent oxidoreductase [Burkholderiales bacterium]|nr:NAD(P)-dependent oxidoreductase [Burkholderiales bacterium]
MKATKASVIGLGMMGNRLAQLLLAAGWDVTVWNRSPAAAVELVKAGARRASTPAEALAASSVSVLIVKDYDAAKEILTSAGAPAAIKDHTLVHLTTGSPLEALEMEAFVNAAGGRYVDGAIQAAPEQMGLPETPIFVSGAQAAFDTSLAMMRVFGGPLHLGERASLASAMDFATLSYVYGATIGFFHGARIIETEGLSVEQYGDLVNKIAPSFGEFLKHEGKVIHSGDYTITQSPLRISIDATRRIAQHARDRGLDASIPELAEKLFRDAEAAGYANEEAAAVIKVLRS